MAKLIFLTGNHKRFLFFILFSAVSWSCVRPVMAQDNATIRGKVVDKRSGETIIGANVLFKDGGANAGTVTDFDGLFDLKVNSVPTTIVVSYIGYRPQEIDIYEISSETLVVSLVEDLNLLNEVVVIGYGTVKKRDLTGSVSSIREEHFNKGVSASVDQLLQGTTPGLNIQQSSSEPGGGVSVRIRGNNSINAGTSPLYVIDGLPVDNSDNLPASSGEGGLGASLTPKNPLNALNTNDIESVEVLKDASATAIYGSRAANGVILITTKKGKGGKTKVSYSFDGGIQQVATKIDVLSTSDYIRTVNALFRERGENEVFSQADIQRIGKGTDWQDEILKEAVVQSHNLSFSGGNDDLSYFTSFNYLDQDGIVRNTGLRKYAARLNLESKFAAHGKIGINLSTSRVNDDNFTDSNSINEWTGPVNAALLYDPTEAVYNSDGTFTRSTFLTINNPVSILEGVSSKSATGRTLGNLFIEYQLTEGLRAKLNLGADLQNIRRDIYNTRLTIYGYARNGMANISTLERTDILGEYTMDYSRQITPKGLLSALAGITYQHFDTRRFGGSVNNFPSDNLKTDNLGLGDIGTAALSSNRENNALLSGLGRVNYSHDNKYLLTASIRADGSSRFGTNNKFGYFPSFAAGWNLSDEKFISELFDNLKLRASWGVTGNQDIGNYRSLSTYTKGGTFVTENSIIVGTSPSRIANPDLKWESTAQTDIGIDAGILNGRLTLTLDYFIKNTRDMLIDLPLPRGSGYTSILSNIGSLQNTGIELLIQAAIVDRRSFQWNTSLNIATVRNKVTDLGDVTNILTGNASNIGNTVIITEGKPAFSYYGYEVIGIFKDDAQVAASSQPNSQPGFPIYRDVNGDGQITAAGDQKIIGDPYPDFTFGFQNTVTYKRFSLSFLFQGQQGGEIFNGNIMESMYPSNVRRNMLTATVADRWTIDNPDGKWPSGTQPTSYGGGKVNTLALQDASYLRLKYAQLSYGIRLKSKKYISAANVYISGQNIFTLSDYIGYDPEANAFGNSSARVDLNTYPLARTWSLGFNLSF
jgi:TonB-linked SusC/RagA family outer membrane protein